MSAPKPIVQLREFEQVRALADPLRQKMLGAFAREPLTTKQVAACLGEKPTRLYHHAEILERTGLIRLVETRRKRGTTEKYFRAVAHGFAVERNLLATPATRDAAAAAVAPEAIFQNAFDTALGELRQTLAAGALDPNTRAEKAMLLQTRIRATSAQVAALRNKIQQWAEKFRHSGGPNAGTLRAVQLVVYAVPERQPKKARRKIPSPSAKATTPRGRRAPASAPRRAAI